MIAIVLSQFRTGPLLAARQTGTATTETSLDLERTRVRVTLEEAGITTADGWRVAWNHLESIAASENGCFEECQTRLSAFTVPRPQSTPP